MGAAPVVHEVIQFHDIAGLVRGAHEGEGLGNQFLGNIRETDAILHVVRAHEDAQVVHPEGAWTRSRTSRRSRPSCSTPTSSRPSGGSSGWPSRRGVGRQGAGRRERWLAEVVEALRAGEAVRTVPPPDAAPGAATRSSALTSKPVLYVANVAEGEPLEPPPELVGARARRGRRAPRR